MARRGETVILAAGDFPKKGSAAFRILAAAKRVVACDGAADEYRRRMRRWPAVIVGDMDSSRCAKPKCEVARVPDQNTNDLEKAARLCAERGWSGPVVLGAAGKREDHTIGNVFRALDLGLEVVTDHGRFVPVEGTARFRVRKGTPVSVFATSPSTRVASTGLEWPLDGVRFQNLYRATLNRASGSAVTISSTRRIYVFFASV